MGKNRFAFLSDFVDAVTRRERPQGATARPPSEAAAARALARPPLERIRAAVAVLTGRIGDAARVAVAEQALAAYAELSAEERRAFFAHLRDDFGVDAAAIQTAHADWAADPSALNAAALFAVVEPRRQELLRRLNLAPGATLRLVRMRQDLLDALREDPTLAAVDQDFAHLLASWFNRGFLTMRRIDWNTPAAILERIMDYETVHAMRGWDDLRRRLEPNDRRLFAFFHPATGDEPLIFVEVALTRGMPEAIDTILSAPVPAAPVEADTAVFYSINASLGGLRGVSFGNFLIKQVVADLSAELPGLRTFVTLSPAPGFAAWLARSTAPGDAHLSAQLAEGGWRDDPARREMLRPAVMAAAARYFVTARNSRGQPADPVARFHLGNGAAAWRVNWPADLKPGALKAAHGLMINYLYERDAIEARHEAFVRDGTVAHGPQLAAALAPKA